MPIRRGRTVRLTAEQSRANDRCSEIVLSFIVLLFLVAIPCILIGVEYEQHEMHEAFEEAKMQAISVISEAPVSHMNTGKLIHVSTTDVSTEDVLEDSDFGVMAPFNTLKLQRTNQYCQWVEHVSEKKDRDGNVEKTYWYTKGWYSRPIPSIFFNQPFRHNNPQRQPFDDGNLQASEVRLASYVAGPRLIDTLPASMPLRLEEYDQSLIGATQQSLAATVHGFRYIGDGYFYSPYEESNGSWFTRLAGQFLEGSLLDIQVTDLFDQCTPGDIRTSFTVARPTSASALGRQLDTAGHIGAWLSSRDYEVGYLQDGIHSVEDMLEAVKVQHRFLVLFVRAAAIAWFYVLLGRLGVEDHTFVRFGVAVAGTAGVLGAIWLCTWGISLLSLLMALFLVVPVQFVKYQTAAARTARHPTVASDKS